MADMNVSMRLTLSDLASGPLKEFMVQLDGLSAKITSLNSKFERFSATSNQFNATNQASSSSMAGLNATVDKLVTGLTALSTRLNSSVTAMKELAPASNAASVGLQNTSRSLNEVAGSASRARDSIRGLAEAYGALKIAKGLEKSSRSEYDLQMQQARLTEAGLSQQSSGYARGKSLQISKDLGIVSQNDVLDARRKLIAAIGQNKEKMIDVALPEILRNAVVTKKLYQPNATIGDIAGSFAGGAELLGRTHSAKDLISSSDVLLRAQAGSQGRLTQGDVESVMRQNKYNPLLNDKSLLWLMAVAEQLKNLGGGGGGGRGVTMAGTGFSMLSKTIMNPKMSKQTAAMYARIGMFEGDAANLATSTTGTVSGNMLVGATTALQDMPGWIENVLAPHMLAYIKKHPEKYGLSKIPTESELNSAITKASVELYGSTGGVNVASMVIQGSSPEKSSMINDHRKMMENSLVGQEAVDNLPKISTSWSKITTSLTNLSNLIGEQLNPKLEALLAWLAGVTNAFTDFVGKTPGAAHVITNIGLALTALLGIRASVWFMRLIGLFGVLGGASTAAAGAVAVSSAAMAATWKTRLLAMGSVALRFVGWLGVAFLLIDATNSIDVAGVSLKNRFVSVMAGLAEIAYKGIGWITQAFIPLGKLFSTTYRTIADITDKASMVYQAVANPGSANVSVLGGKGGLFEKAFGSNALTTGAKDKPTALGQSLRASANQIDYYAQLPSTYFGGLGDQAKKIKEDLLNTPFGAGKKDTGYTPTNGTDSLAELNKKLNKQIGGVVLGPDTPIGAVGGKSRKSAGRSSAPDSVAAKQAGELDKALKFYQDQMANDDKIQQIKNKFEPNIAKLQSVGLNSLAAQLQSQEQKQIGKANLGDAQSKLKDLQDSLSSKESQNAALVTSGVLTPDQAQAKTIADQKSAAPELLKAAEAVRQYQQAIGESTDKIDTTIIKLNALGDGLTQLQQKISNTIEGAFSTFFDQLMGGKTSWKDMGKKFVENIMNGINQSVSQSLSQSLIKGLFGSDTGAGAALRGFGGSGDFMSGIGSFIGNLFGGGGGQTQQQQMLNAQWGGGSSSSGWMSALGSVFSSVIGSFAVGADNIPNDMVAQIHKGEMIIPSVGADAIRSGKLGGQGHTVNMNITAMDSQSVLGAMDGIKRELAGMLTATSSNLNLGY